MAARLFAENYLLKIGYRTGRFAASSMQLFRQRPSQGFKGQWRRKIDNWVGGQYSYIRVLHYQLLLKSIVFKVCEHEYMNIAPPPPQLSIFLRHC